MIGEWSVDVVARHAVDPGMVAIELASPPEFEARPGQFILIRGPDGDGRHFTISSPDVADTFEITVQTSPESQFGAWLASHAPGATVKVEGPFGRTFYESGPAVAIGRGPGLGAAVGVAERARQAGFVATVVAAGPLVHEDRLSRLAAGGATVFAVSTRLTAAVADVFDDGTVYVFGFRDFIDRVRTAVTEAGYDPGEPAYENYGTR